MQYLHNLNTKRLDVFYKTYSNYIVDYNLVKRQEEEIYGRIQTCPFKQKVLH